MGIILSLFSACHKAPPANDGFVSCIVQERINKKVKWNQGCVEDECVLSAIQNLLQEEISVDEAVQVALLNNPEIQGLFEEIGIAQADFVEAGLLRNPIFDGYVRFPDKRHLSLNTEFSVVQNFLDLLLIPLRKKIAEAEWIQTQLKVSHAILNMAYDVEETYYQLQNEEKNYALMKELSEVSEAACALSKAQIEEGNINALEMQTRKNACLEAEIGHTKSRLVIVRLKEKLTQLLGLRCSDAFKIVQEPLTLSQEEIPLTCLEEIALSQRLDLVAARWEVERLARTFGIKEWWAYTNVLIGASSEREAEGFRETGPAFSFELPLFNYGQADRARIRSIFKQSLERLRALEIQVLSEVRSAQDQIAINRVLAIAYQNEMIPLQQQIISSSQQYFHQMVFSVYNLLDAKKREIEMQTRYHSILLDYWISKARLERALGGNCK